MQSVSEAAPLEKEKPGPTGQLLMHHRAVDAKGAQQCREAVLTVGVNENHESEHPRAARLVSGLLPCKHRDRQPLTQHCALSLTRLIH